MVKPNIVAKGTYTLGKINRRCTTDKADGPRRCPVDFEFSLSGDPANPRFSMSASAWFNEQRLNGFSFGQWCDEAAKQFPDDAKAKRMVEVWSLYHLNDMKAGTPEQMAAVEAYRATYMPGGSSLNYDLLVAHLQDIGLYEVEVDGKPYRYGTGWLTLQIPAEIIEEIKGWAGIVSFDKALETTLSEDAELLQRLA